METSRLQTYWAGVQPLGSARPRVMTEVSFSLRPSTCPPGQFSDVEVPGRVTRKQTGDFWPDWREERFLLPPVTLILNSELSWAGSLRLTTKPPPVCPALANMPTFVLFFGGGVIKEAKVLVRLRPDTNSARQAPEDTERRGRLVGSLTEDSLAGWK